MLGFRHSGASERSSGSYPSREQEDFSLQNDCKFLQFMASCLLTIAPYHTDEREHIIEYPGPKCYKRPSNLIIQQSNTTQENIQFKSFQGSSPGRLPTTIRKYGTTDSY